jgi:hypothetical protein
MDVYVGKVSSVDGQCRFNLYMCPMPAVATDAKDSMIDVIGITRGLEISQSELPYYALDLSDSATKLPDNLLTSYEKKVTYWNYYDVELDQDYEVETVINAIKDGLYSNVITRSTATEKYYFAAPHWDVSKDATVNKAGECWSTAYDGQINSGNVNDKVRSIRFNCGNDKCSGTLRIKIGLRDDSATKKVQGNDVKFHYLSGVISFCSI